mmetsp:Transcript_22668/g.49537  ORF Transcript_22668/g.49537 Transcript_22668/m.49537 type:complete len:217 (+) Transcript_22668:154-804(+)
MLDDVLRASRCVLLRFEDRGCSEVRGVNLREQMTVNGRISQIGAEISNALRMARLLEMVVDPAHEDLLRRQLQKRFNLLPGLKQLHEKGRRFEINPREQRHLDHLPDEPQHEVRPHLDQVLRSDVDHGEPDGLGCVEREVEVLKHRERVARLRVDGALVDGVGHGDVDQLAQQHAVRDAREELAHLCKWQEVRQALVGGQFRIDEISEGFAFGLVE